MAVGHKTGGRQKGSVNKTTARVREAIARFADGNVHRLEAWLDEIAEKDPAKAADLFIKILEYHIPKLARTDHTTDGNPIPSSIEIRYVDSPRSE